MPLYDFQCTACGHTFEESTAMGAPPPVCPECGAATERQISPVTTKGQHLSAKGKKFADRIAKERAKYK